MKATGRCRRFEDDRSPPAGAVDEPFVLEQRECLSHGDLGDRELGRELVDGGEALARAVALGHTSPQDVGELNVKRYGPLSQRRSRRQRNRCWRCTSRGALPLHGVLIL